MILATQSLSSMSFESIKSHKAIHHDLFHYLKKCGHTVNEIEIILVFVYANCL